MPVEIREVTIRAELSSRSINNSSSNNQPLNHEIMQMIQSICADQFRQIREEIPKRATQEKFER